MIVTVTLQNVSSITFDTSLVDVKLASGANGDQSGSVFDSDQNLGGGFEGSILPGKMKTAQYSFAFPTDTSARHFSSKLRRGGTTQASHFEGKVSG